MASRIHVADYLPANLREVERWLRGHATAHDWRPFVRYTLECEGIACPSDEQVAEREALTRGKVTRLLHVDARRPGIEGGAGRYPTVISAYCADSATSDRATWRTFMRHITGLVEPGGLFVTSALRRCPSYLVGGKAFPGADVDEHDLRAVLERDFACEEGAIEARAVDGHAAQGYEGVVLAWARRRAGC